MNRRPIYIYISLNFAIAICLSFTGMSGSVAAPAPADSQTPFQIGQMVEVNVNGSWYRASIVNVQNGRYALSRHDRSYGVTTDNEWVDSDRLRPFVAKPVVVPAVAGLPQSIPVGLYTCVTYGTTNTTVGKLRILSGSASSGVTPDGSGAQHRYAYDASTGAITWADGMKISGWTVEKALFAPTTGGKANINLHYRLRAGGNLNSMYCQHS